MSAISVYLIFVGFISRILFSFLLSAGFKLWLMLEIWLHQRRRSACSIIMTSFSLQWK